MICQGPRPMPMRWQTSSSKKREGNRRLRFRLEGHEWHFGRLLLLHEGPVQELNHWGDHGKAPGYFRDDAWRGEHADRERGFQIPLLLAQQAFRRMIHGEAFRHAG